MRCNDWINAEAMAIPFADGTVLFADEPVGCGVDLWFTVMTDALTVTSIDAVPLIEVDLLPGVESILRTATMTVVAPL